MTKTAKDMLIVALDVSTADEAMELVERLNDLVSMFKIGSQLFTAAGPAIVERIVGAGNRVFLDLKFHDIPHQVAGAVRSATELGVSMMTIHASGGPEMMKRAAATAKEVADKNQTAPPFLVAVTVLTSINSEILRQLGVDDDAVEAVKRLATLASQSGVDGVVASPQEIVAIRSTISQEKFLVVTPGIRPVAGSGDDNAVDDQKRVASPSFALAAGASYLVVGRPITQASDASAAAASILDEMERVTTTM